MRQCVHCDGPVEGNPQKLYRSVQCKQNAKSARRRADPVRGEAYRAWRRENDTGGRERVHPGDPDWRKRPRNTKPRVDRSSPEWKERHRATRRAVKLNRRARIANSGGKISTAELAAKFTYWGTGAGCVVQEER